MAKITAAEVNKLRKMTGAGMMDCKKALIEADGDFDLAKDNLRKKGQKIADKRADKEANEGVVLAKTTDDKSYGAIVQFSCETDFVANGDDVVNFVKTILDYAVANGVKTKDELLAAKIGDLTVQETVTDLMGKIGEKLEVRGFDFIEAGAVYAYNHNGSKLASLVGMNKANDEVGHQMAMQTAAMAPIAVTKDGIPQEVLDKEKEIGMEVARQEGKPENMLEKIAMGKLGKFVKENTLYGQAFVRDSKKSVEQYLKETDKDLQVTDLKRFVLGA
jgi:elongation factor Ts